jgi:periplasmic divalent cation tolerance protein
VNQLAPCVSVYRWQEQVETAQEIPLLIKTTRSDYARLENLIHACHPYSCPEIIALPVTAALPDYLHWARQQTQITKE